MAVTHDARRFRSWRTEPPRRRESGPLRGPTLYPSRTTRGGKCVSGGKSESGLPPLLGPVSPHRRGPHRPDEHDTTNRRTYRPTTDPHSVRRQPRRRGRRRARPQRTRLRGAGVPERRRSPLRAAPRPRPARRLSSTPPGTPRGRRRVMYRDGFPLVRSFIFVSWEAYGRRQARLRNKRLGEGRGGRFHPEGLVTSTFSRLRCKPTAYRAAAVLFRGAGVARRRAVADPKDIMSDTSTYVSTIGEQPDEQHDEQRHLSSLSSSTPAPMHRVAQGRAKHPVSKNRSTEPGETPDAQDTQDKRLHSQTNDRNPGYRERGGVVYQHKEKTPIILCILCLGTSTRRRLSKIVHRVDWPILCNPVHHPANCRLGDPNTARRGWLL